MYITRVLKRKFAFRYLFVLVLISLVLVSFHLSLWSDQTANLLKQGPALLQHQLGWGFTQSRNVSHKNNNQISRHQNSRVATTWSEYQRNPNVITGNKLIDNYGKNDETKGGENGRGITFSGAEKEKSQKLIAKYHLNVLASDLVPLNRKVPDARFHGCALRPFKKTLLTASIIVPFHDEWPTILLRTIYSIVNRSPREWLHEIILVDDGSTMQELKSHLDGYIDTHFPRGLIKIVRVPERKGLIQARLQGFRNATGDVIIFFDSHMEVNIDWLPPLLEVVARDRKSVAMGTLDYIQQDTLEYKFYNDYMTRYGFDWRLVFFETFFRNDQLGETKEDIRPGTVMVGAAFAIDRKFFEDIGTYDEKMKVWGGENLELAWRIQLCGGKLVHVPCSHIGHVARAQPYSFPGGREAIEQFNYKRAIEVWMEPKHKELVYNYFPKMKTLDVGDLSERLALKNRLQCRPFSWFMREIWPELFVLHEDVRAWGSARNLNTNKCLDNHSYLFQAPEPLYAEPCHYYLATQGFSITKEGLFRSSLQCVVLKNPTAGERPQLEDCIIGQRQTWTHHQGTSIQHDATGLCLDLDDQGPIMNTCNSTVITQLWQFNTYV